MQNLELPTIETVIALKEKFMVFDASNPESAEQLDKIHALLAGKSAPLKFTSIVLAFSDSTNDAIQIDQSVYDVALTEWDVVHRDCKSAKCICGHDIDKVFYIENQYNQNILSVGSSCVNKLCSQEHNEDIKALTSDKTYSGSRRMCASCLRYSITESSAEYIIYCKRCYSEGTPETKPIYRTIMKYRECKFCHEINILPNEPAWKKNCYDCYVRRKESRVPLCTECDNEVSVANTMCDTCEGKAYEGCRPCVDCGKPRIKVDEPAWKNTCYPCYLASKNSTRCKTCRKATEDSDYCADCGRECIVCHKIGVDKNAPAYRTKCLACFKHDKANPSPNTSAKCADCEIATARVGKYCEQCSVMRSEVEESTSRQCMGCGLNKIAMTEPAWKKTCIDCFRKSRANPLSK